MTTEETVQAELAAKHAERCAARLELRGKTEEAAALRFFAGSLRVGAHLRPVQDEREGAERAVEILRDTARQMGGRG